jgi:hypothetical protein
MDHGWTASASGTNPGVAQPPGVRTDSRPILGERTLPVLVQPDPRCWLRGLPGQRQSAVHHRRIGQAQRRSPVGTVRPDRHSRGGVQQLRADAGLLPELTARRCSWCLPNLDFPTRWYPTPPTMPHQQDMPEDVIKRPDLSGDRIHRPLQGPIQPDPRIVELGLRLVGVAHSGTQCRLLSGTVDHPRRLSARARPGPHMKDGASQPDVALGARSAPSFRAAAEQHRPK